MINGEEQLAAVTREVSAPGAETRTVTLTQTYASDIDDVWDACTNPERIPRWFLPVTGDPGDDAAAKAARTLAAYTGGDPSE